MQFYTFHDRQRLFPRIQKYELFKWYITDRSNRLSLKMLPVVAKRFNPAKGVHYQKLDG